MVQARRETYSDEGRFAERINRSVTALRLIGEGCGRNTLDIIGSARYLGRIQSSDSNEYMFTADFLSEYEGLVRLNLRGETNKPLFNADEMVKNNLRLIDCLTKKLDSSLKGEIRGSVLSYTISFPSVDRFPSVAEGKRIFANIKASLLAMH